jgi:hypothetical protein
MTDTPRPIAVDRIRFEKFIRLIYGVRNELSNHDYLNKVSFSFLLIQPAGFVTIFVCLHSSSGSRCQIAKTAPLRETLMR